MAFDINVIKKVYQQMPGRIEKARQLVGRPLTLSEKILLGLNGFLVSQGLGMTNQENE